MAVVCLLEGAVGATPIGTALRHARLGGAL
jgi:hypothetical protein